MEVDGTGGKMKLGGKGKGEYEKRNGMRSKRMDGRKRKRNEVCECDGKIMKNVGSF